MIPGFVQCCFSLTQRSLQNKPLRRSWSILNERIRFCIGRKCFQSFNLASGILDCLFARCPSIAKSACCSVKKKVAVAAGIYETLWCRFQESDVSEKQNGDKEQNRWALFEHEDMIGAIDWGREAKEKRRFPMTLGIDLRPVIHAS